MKTCIRSLSTAAAALLLAACSSSGGTTTPTAQWTVLVYAVADNNLEPFALLNGQQMTELSSYQGLNLVVQIDRAPAGRYTQDPGAYSTTKRLLARSGGFAELADLGETDMADPATLADFIEWGAHAYPAEHTMLVLWDHGGGWQGFGLDETVPGSAGSDWMTLTKIASGVSQGLQGAGLARFDVIGFDACLMANLETAEALKPYASYLLASEETEPGHGWDYRAFDGAAALDARQLSRQVADAYLAIAGDPQWNDAGAITFSLVDLGRLGPVEAALDALQASYPSPAAMAPVAGEMGRAVEAATSFGSSPDPERSFHLVDLADAFGRLDGVVDGAAALRQAALGAVVFTVNGSAYANATGLAIFFPPQASAAADAYAPPAAMASWKSFLDAYLGAGVATPAFVSHDATRTAVSGGSQVSAGLASGAGLATATLYFGYAVPASGGTPDHLELFGDQPASYGSGSGLVYGVWDETVLSLTQGGLQGLGYMSLQDTGSGSGLAVIPLAYLTGAGDACDGAPMVTRQLVYDLATGAVQSDTLYAEQSGGVGQLLPAAGSGLRALYFYLDSSGGTWACSGDRFDATQPIPFDYVTPSLPAGVLDHVRLEVANPAGQGDYASASWSPGT